MANSFTYMYMYVYTNSCFSIKLYKFFLHLCGALYSMVSYLQPTTLLTMAVVLLRLTHELVGYNITDCCKLYITNIIVIYLFMSTFI